MELKLQTVIREITRKSYAQMFKNAEVGDTILFSIPLAGTGRNGRGVYASYVKCVNQRTGEEGYHTLNQIENIISRFELEEV